MMTCEGTDLTLGWEVVEVDLQMRKKGDEDGTWIRLWSG